MNDYLVQLALEFWLHAYRKNRTATLAVTISLALIFVVGVVIATYQLNQLKKADEARRQANITYIQQLDNLNNVETNLKNLVEFIELEKQRLKESEKLLNDLKNEEQLLKPIVESDRRTVESILEVQNRKAQETASRERWIGFSLGILASLIASIVIGVIRFVMNYRKRKPEVSETTV